MNNPNQKIFDQIKSLVQAEAKKAAEEVYNRLGTQYGVPKTPYHVHNNVDSPYIVAQPNSGGNGTPSSPDTSVQFNNGGSFGGSADFVYDISTTGAGFQVKTPDSASDGRDVNIQSGNGITGNANGGAIVIAAGNSHGTGQGGEVGLLAGDGVNTGANGGVVFITAGDSNGAIGGDVNIGIGVGSAGGTNGNLNISNLPTSAAGLSSGDVYNDTGVLKIV